MAIDYAPPQNLAKPIEVPTKLLMGAGPSNAAESVLKAGSLPLLGHLHAEFIKVLTLFCGECMTSCICVVHVWNGQK